MIHPTEKTLRSGYTPAFITLLPLETQTHLYFCSFAKGTFNAYTLLRRIVKMQEILKLLTERRGLVLTLLIMPAVFNATYQKQCYYYDVQKQGRTLPLIFLTCITHDTIQTNYATCNHICLLKV